MSSKLPEGWPVVRLSQIAELSLGKMLDKNKNRGELRPYLANINVRQGGFDLQNLREMRFEEREIERYRLRSGDIVMCEGGEPGRCALWLEDEAGMMIQKALHRIRPMGGIDSHYLYYALAQKGSSGAFAEYLTGGGIKHLPGEKLAKVEVPIPPLDEQRRIVEVLRSVDEVIGLNRRTMKQAENALKAARGQLTGLDGRETGWAIKPVLDCFQLQRGHDLPVQSRNDGDVPVIASNGPVGFHDHAPVPAPAVITGRSGTIGKVTYFDGPCWPLNTTLFVRDFKGSDPRFVYHFLSAFPLNQHATGTGVPTLNRNDVHVVEVGWPEREEQHCRAQVLDSLEANWLAEKTSAKACQTMKDRLASDLLSGSVRVSA